MDTPQQVAAARQMLRVSGLHRKAAQETASCPSASLQYNVCMQFEWDLSKASANLKKHKVSFEEARTVFYDDFAVQFFDEEHSSDEERFIMLGMSTEARLLVVCQCERGAGEVIRIISARKATRSEASFYQGA